MKRNFLNLYLAGITTVGKTEFIDDLSKFLRIYTPPRDSRQWDDYDPDADVIIIDETNIFNEFTLEQINLMIASGTSVYL